MSDTKKHDLRAALDQYHKKRALAEMVICCLCNEGFHDPYGGHNPDPLGEEHELDVLHLGFRERRWL